MTKERETLEGGTGAEKVEARYVCRRQARVGMGSVLGQEEMEEEEEGRGGRILMFSSSVRECGMGVRTSCVPGTVINPFLTHLILRTTL